MLQLPLLLYDETAQEVEKTLRQMRFDDALIARWRGWRLEYVQLQYGLPHFRLYYHDCLIGIEDVRSPSALPHLRRNLAAYLAGLGYTPDNTKLLVAGAVTPLDAKKHRLPKLF